MTYNIFDLADVFTSLSKENQLDFYEVHDRFYEIGSQQGIKDFSNTSNSFKTNSAIALMIIPQTNAIVTKAKPVLKMSSAFFFAFDP